MCIIENKDALKFNYDNKIKMLDVIKYNSYIIVGIDGIDILDVSEFRYYLFKHEINDELRIKYYRDGNYSDLLIKLDK